MIKAVSPDRANEPLRISILPRRPCRDRSVPYAHRSKAPYEGFAIRSVAIADEISRGVLPAAGFSQLTGNPIGTGMFSDTQPQKLSAGMMQDQKSVQQPRRDRRDNEQVHRSDAVGMIAKKGLP